MGRELFLSKDAEDDIEQVRRWYEKQRQDLEHDFIEEFERACRSIIDFPEMADWISEQSWMKSLGRFPYVIYFTFNEELILIVAVMHNHRATSAWKKRFRGLR